MVRPEGFKRMKNLTDSFAVPQPAAARRITLYLHMTLIAQGLQDWKSAQYENRLYELCP